MILTVEDILLRLGVATAAGLLIGINRDIRHKPIGMRTLAMVALGAATLACAGLSFEGLTTDVNAISRVVQGLIQGIMCGIGFIGAGVILHDSNSKVVHGLTTAATVWVTAAIGIACGLGAWRVIAVSVPLALAVLFLVGWLELYLRHREN